MTHFSAFFLFHNYYPQTLPDTQFILNEYLKEAHGYNKEKHKEEIDMESHKMNHANPGIQCQVVSCYYYMNGDQCTADRIEVLPRDASSTSETDCGTYAKK